MKMDEQELLSILRKREDDAAAYCWGQLGAEREEAMRGYNREYYGTEQDGWSDIVTSDIQDTVEWVKPSLIKIFTSTDKAVSFDPATQNDVAAAEQATDACNYVFYKSNNGFLVLYTAIHNALVSKNCAVHWYTQEKECVSSVPFKQATPEMLAMLTEDGSEIESANEEIVQDQMGNQFTVYSGRLKKTEKKKSIKVEAFAPEDLLVDPEWTTPLLQDCPYVCRLMRVSASDILEMGYKVDPSEVSASDGSDYSSDGSYRDNFAGVTEWQGKDGNTDDDESQAEGWLRIEYVLVDMDGDGIAERREIIRLKNRILSNEITDHVPIATSSPVLIPHRWSGISLAEMVGDLQKFRTEVTRQMMDSLKLANNNRTAVLTDANWNPMVNIDDLLDSRPGGVIRERQAGAAREVVTPFVGAQALPILEYTSTMLENRTGMTRYSQGLDANSLNKTATGISAIMTASQQRIELIARLMAETLLKPIFQGILRLLTRGDMDKMIFRLRDEFVEYDPQEWRDSYDATINVGLGTGNTDQQMGRLMAIGQAQNAYLQMGLPVVNPTNIYNLQAKMTEAAGFKNINDFWTDPSQAQGAPNPQMLQQQMMQMQQQMKQQLQQMQGQYQQAVQENASLKLQVQNKAGELDIKAGELRLKEQELVMGANDESIKAQAEVSVAEIEARSAERIAAMEAAIQHMAQRLEMMQMVSQQREPVSVYTGSKRKTMAIQAPSGQTYTGVIEEEGDE